MGKLISNNEEISLRILIISLFYTVVMLWSH